jgi:hypothetical protein
MDVPAPDWEALGGLLSGHMADMQHRDKVDLHGNAFYGEAIRRLILDYRTGLITKAEADRAREQEHATLAFNAKVGLERADAAQRQAADMWVKSEQRKRYEAAQMLRHTPGPAGKYRREGWDAAAELLWPAHIPAPEKVGKPEVLP